MYRFQKVKDRYQGRIKNPRKSILMKHVPSPPNDLDAGDWVTTTAAVKHMIHEIGTRVGRVPLDILARVDEPKPSNATEGSPRCGRWIEMGDVREKSSELFSREMSLILRDRFSQIRVFYFRLLHGYRTNSPMKVYLLASISLSEAHPNTKRLPASLKRIRMIDPTVVDGVVVSSSPSPD